MSGLSLKKQFSSMIGEKPHSSITDWLEILSSSRYDEDAYEGIPELVDSINLQAAGPTEASRAIRKKLKYGDVHQQLRALTILKALVENCGPKFQTSFANDRLTERIKTMASDPLTNDRVKKKLMSVLGSWYHQFRDDPKMRLIAGLYHACGGHGAKQVAIKSAPSTSPTSPTSPRFEPPKRKAEEGARERKEAERREREAAKRKTKVDKESRLRKGRIGALNIGTTQRKTFDFEKEKPLMIQSISSASQASNNLVNALKLVNREQHSIKSNDRVQECLAQAKAAGKVVVRYIQLVEDEEYIGTLLDSNERVISAIQLYDNMLKGVEQDSGDDDEGHLAGKIQPMNTGGSEPELIRLQDKQRATLQRTKERNASLDNLYHGISSPHPDLQDITFGDLGSATNLPPPIRPNEHDLDTHGQNRGSLSDYSDYDSSDEEIQRPTTTGYSYPSSSRAHDNVFEDSHSASPLVELDADPFADPFADDVGIPPRKQYVR